MRRSLRTISNCSRTRSICSRRGAVSICSAMNNNSMLSSMTRIPDGISTGAAFEQWRREAEKKSPKLLWLTREDIAPSDASLDAERFPDHLSAGPLVVQLRYRFEPGHEDDGVSALVPLHVLNQLPEEPFEWLVPGLFEEKVEALIRSLPKNLRVHFVPVPEAVAQGLAAARAEPGLAARAARRCIATHRRRAGAARCIPGRPASAAPAHELSAARRCRQGDRTLAKPRSAARKACRHFPAGLRQTIPAQHRSANLGVRRSAGTAGHGGRAQTDGLPRDSWTKARPWVCALSRPRPKRA